MLEIGGLVAGYGGGRVLDGVALAVGAGEVVAVLGRNGVGKTTLLKTIMGLIAARAGTIRFEGRDIANRAPFEIARAGVGYAPQGREIFSDFTVEENLRLARLNAENFDSVYAYFPILKERRNQQAGLFSGGQQQQLAIARALVAEPRLLLLDEPSEGVQPSIVHDIAAAVKRIAAERGLSVLLVEQNMDMVFALSQRCVFLEGGRIAYACAIAEARRDPAILDRYLSL